MKKGILSLVLLLSVFFSKAQEVNTEELHVNWQNTFEEALTKAKTEHKPILIYFTGSDWCGPCIQLDEKLFHTQKFVDFSDENLLLYTANFPRNTDLVSKENFIINQKLAKKYNQSSFPTILMIDENGKVLGKKEGAYMPSYYFPFFEEMVNKYKNK